MRRTILLALLLTLLPASAKAGLKVVTTTTDLKWLAEAVGGDRVSVESLSDGGQDLHFVEPRPSRVVKLRRADVLVRVGLDLDGWVESLAAAAKNDRVAPGGAGYVDASAGIEPLQVPTGKVDASMGDLHVYGNPHYWLDPANAAVIAGNIADAFSRVDPANAAVYAQNLKRFQAELDARLKAWAAKAAPLKGLQVVTYHNSWVYFARRFGVEIVGNVEPKPGIPPSPAHLERLISMMKARSVSAVMSEPYFPAAGPRLLAEKTGAKYLVVPSSTGALPGARTYFDVFDRVLDALLAAAGGGAR